MRPRTKRTVCSAPALIGLVVVLAACGSSDDDDPQGLAVDSDATTTEPEADTEQDGADDGADSDLEVGSSGAESDLELDSSDAASDVEVRVAETLTDLDAEVEDGDTVITLPETVLFDFDEHELLPEATDVLDDLVEVLDYFEDAPVRVEGHTDSRGEADYNQNLSEQRAGAVVDHFTGNGVDDGRITSTGFGEDRPVVPNTHEDGSDDADARSQNRRVVIIIEGVDPADIGS